MRAHNCFPVSETVRYGRTCLPGQATSSAPKKPLVPRPAHSTEEAWLWLQEVEMEVEPRPPMLKPHLPGILRLWRTPVFFLSFPQLLVLKHWKPTMCASFQGRSPTGLHWPSAKCQLGEKLVPTNPPSSQTCPVGPWASGCSGCEVWGGLSLGSLGLCSSFGLCVCSLHTVHEVSLDAF